MKNFLFIFSILVSLNSIAELPDTAEKILTQKIDHFANESKTFNQRYWINKTLAVDENSPVLINLCGEQVCHPWFASTQLEKFAIPIKAYTLALEHRYYGKSQPYADLSTASMKHLQVKQVLRDIAVFIKHLRNKENLKGPVILVGGSYPGTLAAYMRVAYPSLIKGAYASSAAVRLIADYQIYDQSMTQIMQPACRDRLREVMSKAEVAMQDEQQFTILKEKFLVPDMKLKDDFLFGMIDVAAAAVQYNSERLLCDEFKGADVVEEFAAFVVKIKEQMDYKLDSYGFSAISDLSITGPNATMRAFFYQQCSEIGLFQTASKDRNLSVRSASLNMEYMNRGCKRVFGREFNLDESIKRLNNRFYKSLVKVNGPSNIYSTAGLLDPYSWTSIIPQNGNALNRNLVARGLVEGAHVDDLNYTDKSPNSVKEAALLAVELIKQWVAN